MCDQWHNPCILNGQNWAEQGGLGAAEEPDMIHLLLLLLSVLLSYRVHLLPVALAVEQNTDSLCDVRYLTGICHVTRGCPWELSPCYLLWTHTVTFGRYNRCSKIILYGCELLTDAYFPLSVQFEKESDIFLRNYFLWSYSKSEKITMNLCSVMCDNKIKV